MTTQLLGQYSPSLESQLPSKVFAISTFDNILVTEAGFWQAVKKVAGLGYSHCVQKWSFEGRDYRCLVLYSLKPVRKACPACEAATLS